MHQFPSVQSPSKMPRYELAIGWQDECVGMKAVLLESEESSVLSVGSETARKPNLALVDDELWLCARCQTLHVHMCCSMPFDAAGCLVATNPSKLAAALLQMRVSYCNLPTSVFSMESEAAPVIPAPRL